MKDIAKRTLDICVSFVVLLLLAVPMLLLAIWIKLDSRGPVCFVQLRAGLNGQPFRIFKLRTMVDRAANTIDQNTEEVLDHAADSRITRAGRFLRSTSLDELPQLINILKGDMSLVGPRPVLMEQKEVVPPGYMKRFSVRPGLTGLAQVRGRRSLGWLQQLAYDAEYIEKRSMALDLTILLQTFKLVWSRSGVYGGEGLNWRTYRNSLAGRPPADRDVEQAMAGTFENTKAREIQS